ncbi:MAG: UDP-2,4-diacetamido-2,4,6-trideoxy-beta-L-altropyranose hydrolase [Opitutaceae bacterium]|nr:UDP-2,4-diacetamido-2,4,6-trideoxy-beta-L-altropyranose hydrolase [Cytophagales bacterium]
MLKPKVFFRADGNASIGLGHITRCMALADMLKPKFECLFVVQNPSQIIQDQIKREYSLIILDAISDPLLEANYIIENIVDRNEILVLDGYNFKTDYQRIIKSKGIKLVCIDDLHAWHFVADVVINHAIGLNAADYSCESDTKLCLGPKYALLRKPFLEAALLDRQTTKIERIFICFGGSDPLNLTLQSLLIYLKLSYSYEINIVIGSAYSHVDSLDNYHNNPGIKIHQNLDAEEMCKLMSGCQLAIAPSSSIGFEICAVGLIYIGGYYVDNQMSIYNGFVQNNCIIELGDLRIEFEKKLTEALLLIDSSQYSNMLQNQKGTITGNSQLHINKLFQSLC